MSNGRDVALPLLRIWFAAGTLLRCEFQFRRFAACFRGRIRTLSDKELAILSDDTYCELVLPFAEDTAFRLGDTTRASPDWIGEYGRMVIIVFPSHEGDEPDLIALIEVKE